MFSATMPREIRKLAGQWLNQPANIQTAKTSAPEEIEQSVYFVDRRQKVRLLEQFLLNTAGGRTLVFSRTKHGADKIVRQLQKGKIRATAIHGNKSQSARKRALDQFKSQSPPVLIATDVAARGLDIKDVEHVINYDLPETPETYVHRIGRTGRAGASGRAVSFCTSDEVFQLRGIERLTRRKIDIALDLPELTSRVAPEPTVGSGKSFQKGRPSQKGKPKSRWQKKGRTRSGAGGKGNGKQAATAGNRSTKGSTKPANSPGGGAGGSKRQRRHSNSL
jgi:ATP-dependent RNA helicase RhlE